MASLIGLKATRVNLRRMLTSCSTVFSRRWHHRKHEDVLLKKDSNCNEELQPATALRSSLVPSWSTIREWVSSLVPSWNTIREWVNAAVPSGGFITVLQRLKESEPRTERHFLDSLPTYEDFRPKSTSCSHGQLVRKHKGTITEVDLFGLDQPEVPAVPSNSVMAEEHIYDILSLWIGTENVFDQTLNVDRYLNNVEDTYVKEIKAKGYEYLRRRGITQKFLHFLVHDFVPNYKIYYATQLPKFLAKLSED